MLSWLSTRTNQAPPPHTRIHNLPLWDSVKLFTSKLCECLFSCFTSWNNVIHFSQLIKEVVSSRLGIGIKLNTSSSVSWGRVAYCARDVLASKHPAKKQKNKDTSCFIMRMRKEPQFHRSTICIEIDDGSQQIHHGILFLSPLNTTWRLSSCNKILCCIWPKKKQYHHVLHLDNEGINKCGIYHQYSRIVNWAVEGGRVWDKKNLTFFITKLLKNMFSH